MTRRRTPATVRFWAKVAQNGECWQWTAAVLSSGYGYFGVGDGKSILAHRFAYQHLVGPIPDGLVIDHLCRNRACVNPYHLEPVPQKINVERGDCNGRTPQPTCYRGHEFTPDNTEIRKGGGRRCVTCRRARENDYKRRRRAEARAA